VKIFIHEFITGGGLAGKELPASLLREGFLMLEALLEDFSLLPQHQIITSYDRRLNLKLPARQKIPVEEGAYQEAFLSAVKASDAVLLIAPETDEILAELTRTVEKEDKLLLGSRAEGVEVAGNKLLTYRRFKDRGVAFPETEEVSFTENLIEKTKNLRFPLILKPIDGAGCGGVFLAKNVDELVVSRHQLARETRLDRFLIQEYVQGVHASVSLISNGSRGAPLTLNAQFIEVSNRLIYKGGSVPLEHPLKQEVFHLLQALPAWIKGLQGYVGVDLVLAERGPVFIEINPRLTTSYIGVRKIVPLNLAEAILEAVLDEKLPREVEVAGQVHFTL